MRKRDFFSGYAIGVFTIAACASIPSFPWQYYTPQMPDTCYDQGALLGELGSSGWPDLAMTACKPDPDPSPRAVPGSDLIITAVKAKCMVVKIDDFYDIKNKYEHCQLDLQTCQDGPSPQ